MSLYDPNIHHRRSIRLKGYDYALEGLYFITLCVQNRAHLFGEIKNGKMILSPYGQIAHEEWLNTGNIRDNVALHEFIVMPDHFHAIIEILFHKGKEGEIGKFKSPSQTVGSIIRGYKIATIKKIKDFTQDHEGGEPRKRETEPRKGEAKPRPRKGGAEPGPRKGELQFAPSIAPSIARSIAPSIAPSEIIKDLDFKIWQRNYHEHIIRNRQAYLNISKYIINNPKK
jgi:REP element-mobilizing transposase RayT